ncbi:MAG: hypothetical protein QXN15_02245 [Candidatus Jordarchaeales archaeon]|nr:hypothetical protein [Candidatus Jordarchaeia archaeon]
MFEEELKEAEKLLMEGETLKAAEKFIQVAEGLDAQGDYLAAAQTFLRAAEIYREKGEHYGAASAFKDAMIRFLVSGKLDEALRVAESVKEEEIRSSPTFAFALLMLEERRKELGDKAAEVFRLEEAEPLSEEDARRAVGAEGRVKSKSVRVEGELGEDFLERVFADMRGTANRRVEFKLRGRSREGGVEGHVSCELVPAEPPYYVAEVKLEAVWEGGLEEGILEGLIPEGFKVVDVEGGRAEEADEGTKVIFSVVRLTEGEKACFTLRATREVARTVVFRRGGLIDAVRTYLPVKREGGEFAVSSEVYGVAGGVDEVFLEDEIPLELSIIEVFPKEGDLRLIEREDTLVRWKLKSLKEGESVKVGYRLERRPRALLFEKELRLKDGRILAKAIKTVKPLDEGKYIVQVSVKNLSRSTLSNIELVDIVPKGHIVNAEGCETAKSNEETRLTWKVPLLKEDETFKDAYWATGDHLDHNQPLYIKLEGYETVKVENAGITRYKGALKGEKEVYEKKQNR